jgi:GTP cyclohydrolase I
MKDVQSLKDNRGIKISEVGVTDLRVPLFIKSGEIQQHIAADVKIGADLFANIKGTHMSRFMEIAEKIRNLEIGKLMMSDMLKEIKSRLNVNYSKVEFSFTYFLTKKSPVSMRECTASYECKITGELGNDNVMWNYFEIKVPVATLCPCSKEISKYGAHNQRADILLRIKTKQYFKIDEIIKKIENESSSELFPILKRVDEKHITEKMYDNPKFVEDVVRGIAVWAKSDKRITDFIVTCKSYESIHSHNAYAIIINEETRC